MLNYEEELKKFKPSLEVEDIEDAVYQEDLTACLICSNRSWIRKNKLSGKEYGEV